ncbi:MAG: proteobacterial dedicated sortase system response regulator [Pseudomonadota bacterium]
MSRSVAVVEDEAAIRQNYVEALARYGYDARGYSDRESALAAFAARLPDLVIIDVGLGSEPEGGFDLCRELRGRSQALPIIFLTARDSDLDIISGLRLGADDYLSKDISLQHLLARVVALFRRLEVLGSGGGAEERVEQGDLAIEIESMTVSWQGQPVALTVTEFWLVHALARFPGHVKNRDQLMDAAKIVVDAGTITSHIKRIRKKFHRVDPAFDEIDTVHGMGYRWRQ